MNHKRKVIIYFSLIFIILFGFIAWIVFELTLDDAKGEENTVKKVYYRAVSMMPVKTAVRLAVPYYHQEHRLSCELAALQMALNYKGIKITESELISQLPIADAGPRHTGNIWGDPNLGFVGDIDGTMPNTGYGVYQQPIYDLAIKYRQAKILATSTLSVLTNELANDNPIVVWGIIGKGQNISWKTPEGKFIAAQMDEHARTLIGFTGTADDPKILILLDPIYGEIRLSTADFLKNWSLLDYQAVVIY